MDHLMDWDQEIQDLVQDLLSAALTVALCRLAIRRQPAERAQFPGQTVAALLTRCGDLLAQHATDLNIWARVLEA